MIKTACDICGKVFQPPPSFVVASFARAGIELVAANPVKVINLRRREPPAHFCEECAQVVNHVLTVVGIPHRYNEYEGTFFIGDELYLTKE